MAIRVLGETDVPAVEAFLLPRLDTSMFLLSNLDAAGIVDHGQTYGGTWIGAGEPLTAIAVSGWNGAVLVQGDEGLEDAVLAAVRATGRPVTVISGPAGAVERARAVLGLRRGALEDEILFVLELADLVVPRMPGIVRAPTDAEVEDVLPDWRVAYMAETLVGHGTREGVLPGLRRYQLDGRHSVLEVDGGIVAYSAFNAVTRGVVQIGGVWTPPALRGRGYGRAVVAGSLVTARANGATRSILFTDEHNVGAVRAYEALGYVRRGRFGLWLPPA
jgi:predicted GNAT family acetyltransferase